MRLLGLVVLKEMICRIIAMFFKSSLAARNAYLYFLCHWLLSVVSALSAYPSLLLTLIEFAP